MTSKIEPVDVIIAEDSSFFRKIIKGLLETDEKIRIMAIVKDGIELVETVGKMRPDVLLMDLIMPNMDGLTAFKKIFTYTPVPTIILSSIEPKDLDSSIQALIFGAFDYIIKPKISVRLELSNFEFQLKEKIFLAAEANTSLPRINEKNKQQKPVSMRQNLVDEVFKFGKYLNSKEPVIVEEQIQLSEPKNNDKINYHAMEISQTSHSNLKSFRKPKENKIDQHNENITKKKVQIVKKNKSLASFIAKPEKAKVDVIKGSEKTHLNLETKIIALGASVGGPKAIKEIITKIPNGFTTPILIVQHIDPSLITSFVKSLDSFTHLKVKIAEMNEQILEGTVYIAPGDKHMKVWVKNKKPYIKLFKGMPYNYCIPSIDILFNSVAKVFGKNAYGILLTGMGSDGVEGMRIIKESGGITIAESKESAVLFGMPKLAIEKGYAKLILPNKQITSYLLFNKKEKLN